MWFFGKKQTEEEKQAEAIQKQSVEALQSGGIPVRARQRCEEHVALGKTFFTSDLSSREWLTARHAGYEVISQVMGSSFMNISLFGGFRVNRSTGEVTAVSKAQLDARQLAVSRMQQEARILRATGVVGVRLVMRNYDWSQRQVEFTAIGTAIRVKGAEEGGEPFTSSLSAQEFWQLHEAGYWPRGICMGVCSYYVWTDPKIRQRLYNWWGGNAASNQEVVEYTQAFYTARESAMNRLIMDIQQHGAEGIVGMTVDQDIEDIEYEINDRTYHDMLVHFNLMGTSIIKNPNANGDVKPRDTLVMMDLRTRSERNLDYSSSGSFDSSSSNIDMISDDEYDYDDE